MSENQLGENWPPQFMRSLNERTAVLERDLYHVDRQVRQVSGQLTGLTERIHSAESSFDSTIRNIEALENMTADLSIRVPDIEGLFKIGGWMFGILKVAIGGALFIGVASGNLTIEALGALVGL